MLGIAAAVTLVPSAVVDAAEGYTMSSSTVYQLDETVPAVFVEATYEMTNTTPNRNVEGGVRYFYFSGMTVPIDLSATELTVQLNGSDTDYELTSDIDGVGALDVEFRSNLRYGRTATLFVRYRLPGSPPRTEASFVRVNPAYASFPAYAFADDGMADLTIDVPSGWEVDYVGDDLTRTEADDRAHYTATQIATPLDFGLLFTARRDDQLSSTPLTVGDAEFELRSWPDDTQWRDFASRHVTDGLPQLERLTGTEWPEAAETDVIEASTPYLRGYAGYYYAASDVIEVGEQLDSHTILHELSHAWFNDANLTERWLSEGLADEIGARAVAAIGEEMPSPDDFPAAATAGAEPFPLNDWAEPTAIDDGSENYGYRTSFTVIRGLFDEIGEARMIELVAAALAGERAYADEDEAAGEGEATATIGPITWRQFLDLAEQIGGSERLIDDYRQLVVTTTQEPDLNARGRALERYQALVERGGAWLPPEAVRAPMADWRFGAATTEIEHADGLLDAHDDLISTLSIVELAPPPSIEEQYQDATELDDVDADLAELTDAAERLGVARAELAEQLATLELDVPALTQAEYESEPIAIADTTGVLVDRARQLAADEAELDGTLIDYALEVPPLPADAFVDSPDDAIELVAARQRAADTVVAAHRRREAAGSVLEQVGRFGSDADAELDRADAALAGGDTSTAIDAAEAATDALDDWDARGRNRVILAAVTFAVSVLVVMAWRIARRRRHLPVEPEPAPDA